MKGQERVRELKPKSFATVLIMEILNTILALTQSQADEKVITKRLDIQNTEKINLSTVLLKLKNIMHARLVGEVA